MALTAIYVLALLCWVKLHHGVLWPCPAGSKCGSSSTAWSYHQSRVAASECMTVRECTAPAWQLRPLLLPCCCGSTNSPHVLTVNTTSHCLEASVHATQAIAAVVASTARPTGHAPAPPHSRMSRYLTQLVLPVQSRAGAENLNCGNGLLLLPCVVPAGGESDVRSCYTAMAVATGLGLDAQALAAKAGMADYIRRCQVGRVLGGG